MATLMMDKPCRHCGQKMRWNADEQCYKCFAHNFSSGGCHREFEQGSKEVCWCPICQEETDGKV